MRRLGYESYLAAGGDWGTIISLDLARVDAEHVRGVHLTWPAMPAADAAGMAQLSAPDLASLDARSGSFFGSEMAGYLTLHITRPLTVSYGLSDSPGGYLAWMAERYRDGNLSAGSPEDVFDRDRLLTTASIYWLTGTVASSIQLYHESAATLGALLTPGAPAEPVEVPVGIAFFPLDPAPPLRLFDGLARSTIVHWSTFEKGGHHGPVEQPQHFVADVRAFARSR